MKNENIVVRIKTVYGVDKVYPVCAKAQLFADIAGTTTLRPSDIMAIHALGYGIDIEQQQPLWMEN
jgi:hypothetical protein